MKRKAVLLLFLAVTFILNAQEKPKYEMKTYISPDGKLYVNKKQPLYVWLSTSPDEGSKKHRLKSGESPQYTNPMYLDTEGFNSLRSPSAVDTLTREPVYPLRDIVFEIYADETSPTTKIDYSESKPYRSEGKSFIRKNTKLTLVSKDIHAGVENIYFSINNEPYKIYSSPITFTEEKEYIVKFYGVDNVGNVEDTREITFVYDITAPKTVYEIDKDLHEKVISGRSKISFDSEDSGVGTKFIKYQIDNGKLNIYKYPISASVLSQGEHTIKYYAEDKVGNTEIEKTVTFYIDKTPPKIIEEVIAKTFFANGKEYASGKALLKLTAFDNKAGLERIMYSINGSDYQLYEKPVFLSRSSGNLVIKSYAIDNVNNKSQSQTANQRADIPYIDLSGPNISHTISGPRFNTRDTLFISSKSKIYLKASDSESGTSRIEYRTDGLGNKVYENAFSIENEGIHTITYVGYDNVENTSSNTFIAKVDNTGPEIGYIFSTPSVNQIDGLNIYPKHTILYLTANDSQNGVKSILYGFNESATTPYTVPVFGFSEGKKKMKIIASDKLRNKTETILEFYVQN